MTHPDWQIRQHRQGEIKASLDHLEPFALRVSVNAYRNRLGRLAYDLGWGKFDTERLSDLSLEFLPEIIAAAEDSVHPLSDTTLEIVHYCVEECTRQKSGTRSVFDMVNAWEYALKTSKQRTRFTVEDVLRVGWLVEPNLNEHGFRTVPAFAGQEKCVDAELVPRAIANLVEAQGDITADELYYEYEKVHPYVDGNGRSGKVLYNWGRHTLLTPQMPPDFFKDPTP